jgi:Flp pilus assembly protein TadD
MVRPQLLAAALSALTLAGCETITTNALEGGPFRQPAAEPAVAAASADPALESAKAQFNEQNYGLAEQQFRKIVEEKPGHAEAWLGLAATYDQLRRFELADRAYSEAIRLAGRQPSILNNRGYSYLLRGDTTRARADLAEARRLQPGNPRIESNWALLPKAAAAQR